MDSRHIFSSHPFESSQNTQRNGAEPCLGPVEYGLSERQPTLSASLHTEEVLLTEEKAKWVVMGG